jgi:predicted RNA-binding protein
MSKYVIKPIKIDNLQFDENNARIPTQKSQLGALTSLLKEQSLSGGKNKIINLVEDISQHGIGPHENFIVEESSHDKDKYIVLEGNRRLAALKLLNDPQLCKVLSLNTVERHRKSYTKIDTVICVVLDRASAKTWIQRKHAGEMDGRGTVSWTRIQRLRSGERTKEIAILIYFGEN